MPRPRRSFQRSHSSQKRLTTWDSGPQLSRTAFAGTGKTLWTSGIVLANEAKATLIRTRGEFLFTLDLCTNAGDGMLGAIGLGIVSDEAFAVGASACPDPYDQPEWPGWFWHTYFNIFGVAAQSAGQDVARNLNADLRIPIDSKGARKFSQGETMIGVVGVQIETGTVSLTGSCDTRMLFKLS